MGDSLKCAGGGLAETANVGGATVADGARVGRSAVAESRGVLALCVVLGDDEGGRGGGEDDSETHFDLSLVV